MKLKEWTLLHLMIYLTAIWGSVHESLARDCFAAQEYGLREMSSRFKLKGLNSAERQALLKKITPKGIRVLLTLRHLARLHNLFWMAVYLTVIVRNLLFRVVSISWFSDYHLLDCFIIGRIRAVGRMYLIGPIAISIFQSVFLYYRFKLAHGAPSRFHFHVFEFLLHDYDEVLSSEIVHQAQPHWRSYSSDVTHANHRPKSQEFRRETYPVAVSVCQQMIKGRRPHNSIKGSESRVPAPPSTIAQRHDPLFYARNMFRDERTYNDKYFGSTGPEWILRPNRTSASWLILARITVLCFCVLVVALLGCFIVVTLILVPTTRTPMGFEVYYPACVRWIQRHQQAELARFNRTNHLLVGDRVLTIDDGREFHLSYSSIHMALGRHLTCNRPISDVPIIQLLSDDPEILPWTFYHTLRFISDTAHTYLFYIDFCLNFFTHFYILLILSIDVVLNTLDIRRRLLKLLDELFQSRHHDHSERIENKQVYTHLEVPDQLLGGDSRLHEKLNQRPSPWQLHKRREHDQLNEHIMSLQSLLIDHFNLIRSYNQFVSHYLTVLLFTLFAFSGAFTVLIFTLKNKAIELEFLVCTMLAVFCVIPLCAGPCITHIYNLQLNSLISRAMALDSNSSLTKFRWIILINHYQPTPLYCFTLFERTPVSWLFCFKLVSWCFSAGLVLANFLHVYKNPD